MSAPAQVPVIRSVKLLRTDLTPEERAGLKSGGAWRYEKRWVGALARWWWIGCIREPKAPSSPSDARAVCLQCLCAWCVDERAAVPLGPPQCDLFPEAPYADGR